MIRWILTVVFVWAHTVPVSATPVTALGDFTPSAPVVTFETFAVNTPGPITVGPMTVSAPGQRVRPQGFTQYAGIFEGRYFGFSFVTFTIDFSDDMMAVGFGLFDANLGGTQVEAFDRNGQSLEVVDPSMGLQNGIVSTYTGVMRTQGDIARIVVSPQSLDLLAVDNIGWKVAGDGVSTIPLPGAAPALVGSLALLLLLRARRR